jgi:hypothetical protein
MAKFTISPGVSLNEIDNTFLVGQPVQAGAAIIGPTVKGPVEIPTLVTSYSDYQNWFGDSFISGGDSYSFFTSIAAYNYFTNGGESLLVTRVVSGSYTPATSSKIANYFTSESFTLETIGKGAIMNSTSTETTNNALPSGSSDNVRWEIVTTNTSSGNFTLLIRQGNDNSIKKTVLETWSNINLDPNSPRYIARVIGDQTLNYNPSTEQIEVSGSYPNKSRYVYVKSVNYPTPNYFDNNGIAKSQYTASLPVIGSGSFGSAAGTIKGGANFYGDITANNTQGLEGANYANAFNILKNLEAYKYNTLFVPGLVDELHSTQITTLITNTEERGDNILVFDLAAYGTTTPEVISLVSTRDTSYAATYFPWVFLADPGTGKLVWVPTSTVIPGVYANNDKKAAPWFAPAGINRGGLSAVQRTQFKLTQGNRDNLYEANINPLATLPREGVVVFGQKTLQKEASALDRVNVRRLMIELKNYIRQIADTVVFEQNTATTRNSFIARVTPYLETIQQKQGLYAFKVIMDDSNNGPDVIDRNQLIGQIYIQPTRTAEFISLDFILLPTGAEFPA